MPEFCAPPPPPDRCHTKRSASALLCSLLLAISLPALADSKDLEESEPNNLSIQGFGTLGLARTTNDGAQYLRTINQAEGISNHWSANNDSLLGVQAAYRFNHSLSAAVQGISSYRYDGSFKPSLSAAYLKYDVSPTFSILAGRMATEFVIGSNSRSIGYSYATVRPAVEFFGMVPFNYGDGLGLQTHTPLGDGLINGDFFVGKAREHMPSYSFDNADMIRGSIGYAQTNWQVRYLYGQAKLASDVPAIEPLREALVGVGASDTASALGMKDSIGRYQSIGIDYDDGLWQTQAAFSTIRETTALFQNTKSAYVLVSRRLGKITPFIQYGWAKSQAKSRETGLPDAYFGTLNQQVAMALGFYRLNQHTTSIGARWDIQRNVALKGQVDFVRAAPDSKLLFSNISNEWNGRSTVLSLSLDFIF